jgi:hypothetical protein
MNLYLKGCGGSYRLIPDSTVLMQKGALRITAILPLTGQVIHRQSAYFMLGRCARVIAKSGEEPPPVGHAVVAHRFPHSTALQLLAIAATLRSKSPCGMTRHRALFCTQINYATIDPAYWVRL